MNTEICRSTEGRNELPIFTTIVEAEPWQKGHVARITSLRVARKASSKPRIIESRVLA